MRSYLGKRIQVIIDRPLGSNHPEHGYLYPINYGYIPNTIAGDGEPIDAYIIGVDEPIQRFEGRVLAWVHRFNDVEDKLVVAPIDGLNYTKKEIEALIHFQEQFFQIEVNLL